MVIIKNVINVISIIFATHNSDHIVNKQICMTYTWV